MSRAEVTDFPGAAQVPTVGERICPFMSKAVPVQKGIAGPMAAGMLTVNCAGEKCRLWGLCSGRLIERLIDVVAGMGEMLQKGKE